MELFDQLKKIGLLVLGAVILIAHVAVFMLNQFAFSIILSIYIIGYTILIIVLSYKNKDCYNEHNKADLNLIYNMSFYTIFLQIFLIILAVGLVLAKKFKKD